MFYQNVTKRKAVELRFTAAENVITVTTWSRCITIGINEIYSKQWQWHIINVIHWWNGSKNKFSAERRKKSKQSMHKQLIGSVPQPTDEKKMKNANGQYISACGNWSYAINHLIEFKVQRVSFVRKQIYYSTERRLSSQTRFVPVVFRLLAWLIVCAFQVRRVTFIFDRRMLWIFPLRRVKMVGSQFLFEDDGLTWTNLLEDWLPEFIALCISRRRALIRGEYSVEHLRKTVKFTGYRWV